MRSLRLTGSLFLILCLCISVSGCASMRYPRSYRVEGTECEEFKELNDDQALKMVALIYNVHFTGWEDNIAKSLTLGEFIALLEKRRSQYIEDSGIFDLEYEKIDISSWSDEDLIKLYKALLPRTEPYYIDSAHELTEEKNAERIIFLTGLGAVVKELKKRETTSNAMYILGQVLSTALTVALQMI